MIKERYKYETVGDVIAEMRPAAFFIVGFILGWLLAAGMFG